MISNSMDRLAVQIKAHKPIVGMVGGGPKTLSNTWVIYYLARALEHQPEVLVLTDARSRTAFKLGSLLQGKKPTVMHLRTIRNHGGDFLEDLAAGRPKAVLHTDELVVAVDEPNYYAIVELADVVVVFDGAEEYATHAQKSGIPAFYVPVGINSTQAKDLVDRIVRKL